MTDRYHWTAASAAASTNAIMTDAISNKPRDGDPATCSRCGSKIAGGTNSLGNTVGTHTCSTCGNSQLHKPRPKKNFKLKYCYICNQTGHVNFDCRQRMNEQKETCPKCGLRHHFKKQCVVCHKCGKYGHKYLHCRGKKKKKSAQPEPVTNQAFTDPQQYLGTGSGEVLAHSQVMPSESPLQTKQLCLSEKINMFLQRQQQSSSSQEDGGVSPCSNCGERSHDSQQCHDYHASFSAPHFPSIPATTAQYGNTTCQICGGFDHQDNECVAFHSSLPTKTQKIISCPDYGTHKMGKKCRLHQQGSRDRTATTTPCSSCNNLGHLAKDCTVRQYHSPLPEVTPGNITCSTCGRTDHLSGECNEQFYSSQRKTQPLLPHERDSLCTNCGETGHHFSECTKPAMPKPDPTCSHCGQKGHRSKMCPICEWCGKHGHLIEACPLGPYAFNLCLKCGDRGHVTNKCPHNMFCKTCKTPGHLQEDCKMADKGDPKEEEFERPSQKEGGSGRRSPSSPEMTRDMSRVTSSEFRTCSHCGDVGHSSVECNACASCGKPGHVERDCPSKFEAEAYEDINSPPSSTHSMDLRYQRGHSDDNGSYRRSEERDLWRQREREPKRGWSPEERYRDIPREEPGGRLSERGRRYSGEREHRHRERYSQESDERRYMDRHHRESQDRRLSHDVEDVGDFDDRRHRFSPDIDYPLNRKERLNFPEDERPTRLSKESDRGSLGRNQRTFSEEREYHFLHSDIDDIKRQFLEERETLYSAETVRLPEERMAYPDDKISRDSHDDEMRYLTKRERTPLDDRRGHFERSELYASPNFKMKKEKAMMAIRSVEEKIKARMQEERDQNSAVKQKQKQVLMASQEIVARWKKEEIEAEERHSKGRHRHGDSNGSFSRQRGHSHHNERGKYRKHSSDDNYRRSRSRSYDSKRRSRNRSHDAKRRSRSPSHDGNRSHSAQRSRTSSPTSLSRPITPAATSAPTYRQMPWEEPASQGIVPAVPGGQQQHQQQQQWPIQPTQNQPQITPQISPPANVPPAQPLGVLNQGPNPTGPVYRGPGPGGVQPFPTPPIQRPPMQGPLPHFQGPPVTPTQVYPIGYQGQPGPVRIQGPPVVGGPMQQGPPNQNFAYQGGAPPRMGFPKGTSSNPVPFPSGPGRPYPSSESRKSPTLAAMDAFVQKLMRPKSPRYSSRSSSRSPRRYSSRDSLSDDSSLWDSRSSRSRSSSPHRLHFSKRSRGRHRLRSRSPRSHSRGHSRLSSEQRSRRSGSGDRGRRTHSHNSRSFSGERHSKIHRSTSKEWEKQSRRKSSPSEDHRERSPGKHKDQKERSDSHSSAPKEQQKQTKTESKSTDQSSVKEESKQSEIEKKEDANKKVKGKDDDSKKGKNVNHPADTQKLPESKAQSQGNISKGKGQSMAVSTIQNQEQKENKADKKREICIKEIPRVEEKQDGSSSAKQITEKNGAQTKIDKKEKSEEQEKKSQTITLRQSSAKSDSQAKTDSKETSTEKHDKNVASKVRRTSEKSDSNSKIAKRANSKEKTEHDVSKTTKGHKVSLERRERSSRSDTLKSPKSVRDYRDSISSVGRWRSKSEESDISLSSESGSSYRESSWSSDMSSRKGSPTRDRAKTHKNPKRDKSDKAQKTERERNVDRRGNVIEHYNTERRFDRHQNRNAGKDKRFDRHGNRIERSPHSDRIAHNETKQSGERYQSRSRDRSRNRSRDGEKKVAYSSRKDEEGRSRSDNHKDGERRDSERGKDRRQSSDAKHREGDHSKTYGLNDKRKDLRNRKEYEGSKSSKNDEQKAEESGPKKAYVPKVTGTKRSSGSASGAQKHGPDVKKLKSATKDQDRKNVTQAKGREASVKNVDKSKVNKTGQDGNNNSKVKMDSHHSTSITTRRRSDRKSISHSGSDVHVKSHNHDRDTDKKSSNTKRGNRHSSEATRSINKEYPKEDDLSGEDSEWIAEMERSGSSRYRLRSRMGTSSPGPAASSARTRIHSWIKLDQPKVDLSDPTVVKISYF